MLARHGSDFADLGHIEAFGEAAPGPEVAQYSMYTFGAMFCEVHVDPELGQTRVTGATSVVAAGRIVNPRTARN